jgi:hypothetical protein
MIHLKRFNEKIQWNRDRPELLKFCEEYLAYLLDEGFDVSVRLYEKENRLYRNGIRDEGYISIQSKNNTFKWNDVKEDFIPFLEMLVIKYDLVERLVVELIPSIGNKRFYTGSADIKMILDGRLTSRVQLEEIRIKDW